MKTGILAVYLAAIFLGLSTMTFGWSIDHLVNSDFPSWNEANPSMTVASNGDLFLAAEDIDGPYIDIFQSTDGGRDWSWIFSFDGTVDACYPSITYAEGDGNRFLYIAYENDNGTTRDVNVYRYCPDNSHLNVDATVKAGIYNGSVHIHPEICTDYLDWLTFYVYITYDCFAPDYYPVFFSRTTDRGESWSTPVEVTGPNGTNGSQPARPDITMGTTNMNLFIAFQKMGYTDSSWDPQIFVTNSSDFGVNWSTPVMITNYNRRKADPRIVAPRGSDSLLVAYTSYWDAVDTDIKYNFSTDKGATWSTEWYLTSSLDTDKTAELAVSQLNGKFHAAFWRNNDVYYCNTDVTTPNSWSSPIIIINEAGQATANYTKPAVGICPLYPTQNEARVAWTDVRNTPYYNIYADRACAYCPDVDESGMVDFADLQMLIGDWLWNRTDLDPQNAADINCDGRIDLVDFNFIVNLWLASCP